MQRYKNKDEVKLGDVIVFDNTTGFINDFIRANTIGEVIAVGADSNIRIKCKIGVEEYTQFDIPYFLAQ